MLAERLRQHRERAGVVAGVAQQLRLGLANLDLLLEGHHRQVAQVLARLVHAFLLAHHRGDAQLPLPRALAFGQRAVALDREVEASGFLGDLREIELDDAVLAVVRALEIEQQLLGASPSPSSAPTARPMPNSYSRADLSCVPQPLEDRARVGVALLLDVELRQRARSRARRGVGLDDAVEVRRSPRPGSRLPRISDFSRTAALPAGLQRQRAIDARASRAARMPMSLRPVFNAASATAKCASGTLG